MKSRCRGWGEEKAFFFTALFFRPLLEVQNQIPAVEERVLGSPLFYIVLSLRVFLPPVFWPCFSAIFSLHVQSDLCFLLRTNEITVMKKSQCSSARPRYYFLLGGGRGFVGERDGWIYPAQW
jgi:hypothetical protein